MRCSRVRHLLHLDGEGELHDRLRDLVLRHASTCPGCAAELARIRSTKERYTSLKGAVPVLSDPAGLTATVMERVARARPEPAWIRRIGSGRSPGAPVAGWTGLRLAAGAAVALFFIQSLHDAGRMADLDRRLTAEPGTRIGGYEDVVQHAGLVRQLRVGPVGSTAMMDRLRERYGALFAVTTEDGLDERERRILATEGRAVLHELEHLVNLAEGNHEH